MSEKINLDQEKLEMFYNQFGSKKLVLQHEMSKDFGEKTLDLYYKSIDFIYKTITTIGIIAGFGFTGMDHAQNSILFIIGEGFLFSAIAFGIWVTQKIYLKEKKNLNNFYGKVRKHFSEWYELFRPIFDKAIKNELTRDDVFSLQKKDEELASIFSDSHPDFEKDRKNDFLPTVIWIIFGLFVVGIIMLLLSFLIY